MPKVLLVSGSLPPIRCGVGYYAESLSRELAKKKVDFEILSTEGVDKGLPAPLLSVPDWKIGSLPKMLSAVRQSGADIVHIQYPAVGYRRQLGINLLPYVLRLLCSDVKILITLHEYHDSRALGRLRDYITVVPAHRLILSNAADKLALPVRLSLKSRIVPIGSNLEKAAKRPKTYEAVLRKHRLDPQKPTILFFGFAHPAKHLEILLQAMAEPFLAGWQLLLLSDLKQESRYHQGLMALIELINQDGVRVAATGFLPDEQVSEILQGGRYFVLPQTSPINAKSSTAIAAVQHGLILVTRGGQPKLVEPFKHLENCYLLDEMSAPAIAGAIERLEKSAAERQKITAGTKKLADYFSWKHIAAEHLRIYKEL